MESAFMTVAKEIRSRDQGYTQQGGDSFTVKTVGPEYTGPQIQWQMLAWSSMQGCRERQNIFHEIMIALILHKHHK